ncbi:MAG: hypothetical protein ACXWPV_01900 [Candidatus Limnocylindrales bacterium]
MSQLIPRTLPAAAAVLLVLALSACTTAGQPADAARQAVAGGTLAVPTWPPEAGPMSDPEAGLDGSAASDGAAGRTSGAQTSPGTEPADGPGTPVEATPGGGSAATDPALLSLSQQVDRALNALQAALQDDAASTTDEGDLP